MSEKELTVTNLGPIDHLTIELLGAGVNVVSAPNGSGKSTLCSALERIAAGKGQLPLRDGTAKGSIDGFGIHCVISPSATRVSGEFALETLEDRIDGAYFVDPAIKDPVAADKRRFKALVGLLGVEARPELFSEHRLFDAEEFAVVVQRDTLACDDLVELANRVTRDYQTEARQWERMAAEDAAKAKALSEQLAGLDMTVESDADKLQHAYVAAQQDLSHAAQRQKIQADKNSKAQRARERLEILALRAVPPVEEANLRYAAATEDFAREQERVNEIMQQLARLKQELADAQTHAALVQERVTSAKATLVAAEQQVEQEEECRNTIEDAETYDGPTDDDVAACRAEFERAKQAMADGVRVRDAHILASQRDLLSQSAETRRARAEHYRACAAAVDTVLAEAIQSQIFEVRTVGQNKRLFVWHEGRQAAVPYHDLSAAEKWTRYIDEASNRLGAGGLILVRQEAWEGMDVWNRQLVHEHLIERGMYALAFEATRDAKDGEAFKVQQFEA